MCIILAPERVGQRIAGLHKAQRHRVDTVAQAGGRRTVGEDVALVAVATGAAGLDSDDPVGYVSHGRYMGLVEGCPERWPAGAALKLGLILEKRQAAEAATVDALLFLPQKAAAERCLGAVAQQNVGFLAGEGGLQGLAFRIVRGR